MLEEFKVTCPWCSKGKVYAEPNGRGTLTIQCPKCRHCFRIRLDDCSAVKIHAFHPLMYYSDVLHLIEVEKNGESVATWYANPIWQKCKGKVTDKESALRLSRVMRDNRNIAMMLLSEFIDQKEYLFLLTLLHLEYADYDYEIIPYTKKIHNQIVTVQFSQRASTLRYVSIQKTRKIRVAFSSLAEYAKKDNRNGYMYSTAKIMEMKSRAFSLLAKVAEPLKEINRVSWS